MRSILVFFMAAYSFCLFAQFQLTADSMAKVGEEYISIPARTTNVVEGPAGAGLVWDYRHLQPSGLPEVTISYQDPTGKPGSSFFPGATLVEEQRVGTTSYWQYWGLNQQQLLFLGVATPSGNLIYSDPEASFTFPSSYGSLVEDGFVATARTGNARIDQIANSTTLIDSYGSLIMPDATYPNVMRVLNVQNVLEQYTDNNSSRTSTIVSVRFCWYAEGISYPILTITYVEVSSQGQVEQGKSVFYRSLEPVSVAQTQWMPHVTADGGGFETTFYFKNLSEAVREVRLNPYDASGNSFNEMVFNLQPKELRVLTQNELFSSQPVSHFRLDHSEDVKVTAAYKMAGENGASAHLHETARTGTRFRVYPGERNQVFDGMALVNTSNTNVAVVATLKDSAGNNLAQEALVLELAPGAKYLGLFDQIFPDDSNGLIEIQTSDKVAVSFLRGSWPGTNPAYLYANLAQEERGAPRWIPHVTSPTGGFQTRLFFYNSGSKASFVEMRPYSGSGGTGALKSVDLSPGETRILTPTEIFGTDSVSHIEIVSNTDVLVSAGYRAASGEGATAHLHETSRRSKEFWIYPGEWDLVFDGMALVNLGTEPATLVATQFDRSGNVLATKLLVENLAVNGKYLAVFGDSFAEVPNSMIKITSTQQAAALFLRGTPVGQEPAFLYPNLPLSE